jgi:hypothetical protein
LRKEFREDGEENVDGAKIECDVEGIGVQALKHVQK